MKRRHRRLLFNLFAFSLLGIAVYLNVYRINDGDRPATNSVAKSIVKTPVRTNKTNN
jgi:hypothetical protein